jgi:hypothetical protein
MLFKEFEDVVFPSVDVLVHLIVAVVWCLTDSWVDLYDMQFVQAI